MKKNLKTTPPSKTGKKTAGFRKTKKKINQNESFNDELTDEDYEEITDEDGLDEEGIQRNSRKEYNEYDEDEYR